MYTKYFRNGMVIIVFENKKLYKDISRKKICGVLAGLSDYINADVTLLRIFFVLFTIKFPPVCLITYFVSAFILPDKHEIFNNHNDS